MPWDDPSPSTPWDKGVVGGETINFMIDGKAAVLKVIDAKGPDNRLDLAVYSKVQIRERMDYIQRL